MKERRRRSVQLPSESDYEFEGWHFLATFDPAQVFDPSVDFFCEFSKANLAILASRPEELAEKFRFVHRESMKRTISVESKTENALLGVFSVDNVIFKG